MIVAERKPIQEIADSVRKYEKLLIVGCGTCVTVSLSGGENEAFTVANLLSLVSDAKFDVTYVERQCEPEFLEKLDEAVSKADAVLSLACGVGVQFMAERYPDKPVLPALNTTFMGVNRDVGYLTEMCQGCGNCILEKTGGVCPVARCSKSHFNGPCGGSQNGKCEISNETDCAWQLIYERLKRLDQLDRLCEIIPPRDWRTSRDGGPRKVDRRDLRPEVE
ncbi:MAG: hypothetical protein GXX89_04740 [Clostridiales bacterium]|jgi:ferredoxin|nr:hypothetical protein [Clostridiales bacterium]